MGDAVRALSVLAAVLLSGPAQAEAMSQSVCASLWGLVADVLEGGAMPVRRNDAPVLSGGGCAVRNVELGPDTGYGAGGRIGEVRWSGAGLVRFAEGAGLPERLVVEVDGLRIAPVTGDPAMDYLLGAQTGPEGIAGRLSAYWVPGERRLVLETAELNFPGDNSVRLTADIARVDLSSMSTLQTSVGTMALTAADLEFQTNGLFESVLLMPLGTVLLSGAADPEAEVQALIAQGVAAVEELPAASFDPATKAAMKEVLTDLPHPAGTLRVTVRAPGGFGAARLTGYAIAGVPSSVAELAPLLNGVEVGLTYARTPPDGP
jgi:hypothetical protein